MITYITAIQKNEISSEIEAAALACQKSEYMRHIFSYCKICRLSLLVYHSKVNIGY